MLEHHPHAPSVVMSYLGVRRSLGLLAFLLPLALGPFGFFVLGIQIQDNMSSGPFNFYKAKGEASIARFDRSLRL